MHRSYFRIPMTITSHLEDLKYVVKAYKEISNRLTSNDSKRTSLPTSVKESQKAGNDVEAEDSPQQVSEI